MNLSRNKVQSPTPPEYGSFPLDHLGECTAPMKVFIDCLDDNVGVHRLCHEQARAYIRCRLEKNLMSEQVLREYGFYDDNVMKVEPTSE